MKGGGGRSEGQAAERRGRRTENEKSQKRRCQCKDMENMGMERRVREAGDGKG